MKILAIETSCDETAIALIDAGGGLKNPRFKILKNLVASQIKIHRPFGGVVPNLAKREHLKNLPLLFDKIIKYQISKIKDIDIIAVTVGPGLEPALWTGINFVKEIHVKCQKLEVKCKMLGVSHLEGHLYSFFLNSKLKNLNSKKLFPAIALIISGGHTILIKMDSPVKYKKIGETRDDAVGEAFDKVARLLNLPYPGGPEIEKLAKFGNPNAINFPRPMLNQKNYDFSFSGLKTAVLYYLRSSYKEEAERFSRSAALRASGHGSSERSERESERAAPVSEHARRANGSEGKSFRDIAASFQRAAFDVLISKTLRAAEEFGAKSIFISGGVAANKTLQKQFKLKIKDKRLKIKFFAPVKKFCTDNAAMIAAAGYINYLRNKKRRLTAKGNLEV